MKEHDDVRFFQRGRRRLVCDNDFLTAEAPTALLHELTELRDMLSVIKHDTEQYIVDSQKTSESLESLNGSLNKLRALKIYQKQKWSMFRINQIRFFSL